MLGKHSFLRLPAALILLLSFPVSAANWPEFRGPSGNGNAATARLPVTWSETKHVRWKVALPGQGWSTPVAWDGQLWMTAAEDQGRVLFALCVGSDGKLRQRVKIFSVKKTFS